MRRSAVVGAAFGLDRALGDPVRPTHPVRLMGHAITAYEQAARRLLPGPAAERAAGVVLALGLPLSAYVVVAGLLRRLPEPLRGAAETWLLATALAGRDLGEAACRVEQGLDRSLDEGRAAVGMIVGRETARLDEAEVVRATVETVAENTSDGMVAPLLYGLAGGAPLALAYKAVSTLDSMVGYRNERYRHFGWASARLDDLVNLVPARVTAAAVTAAGGRGWSAVRRWRRDGHLHESPNAGVVEASFAQALRLRLGGPACYNGRLVDRQPMGPEFDPPQRTDIRRAVRLSDRVADLVLAAGLASLWLTSLASARRGSPGARVSP